MRKLLGFAVLLVLLIASTTQRPLEAKDKDEIVALKGEVLVMQKQIRDLQESSDKNTGQVTTLLNQVVDGISVARRDVGETRNIIDRNLSEVVTASTTTAQQVTRLNERLNATDQRIERVETQLKELKNIFNPSAIITNCDNGDQQYSQAYGDYLRGNYSLAVEQFRNYVRCFAQTENAGNAQYLIGDAYYKQLDFKTAATEFDKLLLEYPTNNKAVVALFKKSDSLLKTERRKEAEDGFKLLVQSYPGTPEARQAEEILRQLPPPEKTPTRPRR
jgi:tol-pal system protein YbgF